MTILRSRIGASLAVVAAATLSVSPAMAQGRRYPPPPRHHHHHDNGIDGGDLLAGLLIVGGIAAIVSAASKSDRADRAPAADANGYVPEGYSSDGPGPAYPGGPVPGDPGYGVDDGEANAPRTGAGSFGIAVDACTGEVEQGGRDQVDTVDKVSRMNGRVAVEGRLADGRAFACSVDEDNRIRSVAIDGHAVF